MADFDCEPFDVVVAPFPFTDRNFTKKRPALVISNREFNRTTEHCVLVMITSAKNSSWPLDTTIQNLDRAGLPVPSVIRAKLFTLDKRVLLKKLGALSEEDIKQARKMLGRLLPLDVF